MVFWKAGIGPPGVSDGQLGQVGGGAVEPGKVTMLVSVHLVVKGVQEAAVTQVASKGERGSAALKEVTVVVYSLTMLVVITEVDAGRVLVSKLVIVLGASVIVSVVVNSLVMPVVTITVCGGPAGSCIAEFGQQMSESSTHSHKRKTDRFN